MSIFGEQNKANGTQYGLVGNALNGVSLSGVGSSLSGIGNSLSGIFSGIFHEGGTAGDAGPGRWISAGVFEGAARYHQGGIAGLMPGEVPAILQKGETVILRGGAGPGGAHTFIFQTPDPGAFRESSGQIAAMITQAVSRGQRNL